jgi:hypothetical protein
MFTRVMHAIHWRQAGWPSRAGRPLSERLAAPRAAKSLADNLAAPASEGVRHRSIAPLARIVAVRRAAPAPTLQEAARRRTLIDMTWPQKSGGQVAPTDLAAPVRSMAGPSFTHAASKVRSAAAGPAAGPAATLPDAGRLVDEVMDRLDRRMRSERLRRGL